MVFLWGAVEFQGFYRSQINFTSFLQVDGYVIAVDYQISWWSKPKQINRRIFNLLQHLVYTFTLMQEASPQFPSFPAIN